MTVIDTTVVLTAVLWRKGVWEYHFFAAPMDTLKILVRSSEDLDGVYFGEFGKKPKLSEIYTDSIFWTFVSDTVRPYTLRVEKSGLWKRVRVDVVVERFPAPGWRDFKTTLRIRRVKVPYEDTLWDTVVVYLGKWEVFMPPKSDIFFSNTYGKEPRFTLKGPTSGVIIYTAPLKTDDSLRFRYGEFFLENPFYREEVCGVFSAGKVDLYVLRREEYERARLGYPFSAVDEFLGISFGCFHVGLTSGEYGFVLENRADEALNQVVRILQIRLKPITITRYRVVEEPTR